MDIATPLLLLPLLCASLASGLKAGLGTACYYDEECDTLTTYCRNRQSCDCKDNFKREGSMCVATAGARCMDSSECSSLAHSECQDQTCVCTSGYVTHPQQLYCLAEAGFINDKCEVDDQCQRKFGPFSGCLQDKLCKCRDGYHHHLNWCFPNTGLGQPCANESYCYLSETERHKVRCAAGTCQCADYYRRSDNTCVDSVAGLQLSLATVALCLTTKLLLH